MDDNIPQIGLITTPRRIGIYDVMMMIYVYVHAFLFYLYTVSYCKLYIHIFGTDR